MIGFTGSKKLIQSLLLQWQVRLLDTQQHQQKQIQKLINEAKEK
jgi:hypothetical protein